MGQASAKLRRVANGYSYWCQGCGSMHTVRTDGPTAIWGFDGNVDAPTFTPSVLTTSGHYVPSHQRGSPCWCTYNRDNPQRPSHCKCERRDYPFSTSTSVGGTRCRA